MAFNFNWSPLTADADFYSRAKDLLTIALNKSPKPPIIVDDILVNELNLGSVPPELEILEIGDLAEDRFRGIFKMCYSGDAYLTLKTRVQANPLNTYLFSKPSFTSPQPLAAASGLTIPLQITLSEIKLSAFIILVFSRQKGITLVFRNDPLESLKVSSTFDSIRFVREYLQKEIEMQLRTLMMDELPAIIHRLSLRLWCLDYAPKEGEELAQSVEERRQKDLVDPLASPPQDAIDAYGNIFDSGEISALSLDSGTEIHSLFSQKNILRLAALGDSQRTLSLFTPSITEAVFRAWSSPSDRGDGSSSGTPSLIRSHSTSGSHAMMYSFPDSESEQLPSRLSLANLHSNISGLSLGAGRHSRSHGRKKKIRVINLRKPKALDGSTSGSDSASITESSIVGDSEPAIPTCFSDEREEELVTPPRSPNSRTGFRPRQDSIDLGESPRSFLPVTQSRPFESPRLPVNQATQGKPAEGAGIPVPKSEEKSPQSFQSRRQCSRPRFSSEKLSNIADDATSSASQSQYVHTTSSGVIEQALLKIASEIVRRAGAEKSQFWESTSDREDTPPPAYEIQ